VLAKYRHVVEHRVTRGPCHHRPWSMRQSPRHLRMAIFQFSLGRASQAVAVPVSTAQQQVLEGALWLIAAHQPDTITIWW
jgi:hypothetical protein